MLDPIGELLAIAGGPCRVHSDDKVSLGGEQRGVPPAVSGVIAEPTLYSRYPPMRLAVRRCDVRKAERESRTG